MKPMSLPADKVAEDGASVDRGYAAWKTVKVERGLAQSKDRGTLIPIDQVWRDLQLEG